MREIYRKRGVAVRFEHDRLITVHEAGEAVEEGGSFFCQPLEVPSAPEDTAPMEERVQRAVAQIRAAVSPPLSIERLLVSEGRAQHEFGGNEWEETFRRVHLSVVHGEYRALVDLGDFDVEEVARVAAAMQRIGPARKHGEKHGEVRLAPPVAAALLPNLVGVAPPNILLMQSSGGRDGKGQLIGEWTVETGASAPNWYRPSYRVRPQRVPLNLRATCTVTEIDSGLPQAIALLAPLRGITVHALCVDGDAAYPAAIRITRIDAIAHETAWYPYAAGSFGSEMAVF